MSIKSILKHLLDDRLILSEVFHSGHKLNFGGKSSYIEVFKNPDMSEMDDIVNTATYDGAKAGVDKDGNVYVWIDDILHAIMEKALKLTFVIRFDYTKGNPVLFLAGSMTEKDWKDNADPKLVKRVKNIFPDITSIELVSKPFSVVHTY
jgi:hypothetical protein